MKQCKYYNKHLDTIKKLIECLYSLENCGAGGLLHILLDDYNDDDDGIKFCLNQCEKHPEKQEAELGKLICNEFLKLSQQERDLLLWHMYDNFSCNEDNCYCCAVEVGEEEAFVRINEIKGEQQ